MTDRSAGAVGAPGWDGQDILHLSLCKARPRWLRLDTLPFMVLYGALSILAPVYRLSINTTLWLLSVIASINVLMLLMQHWLLRLKVLIAYSPLRTPVTSNAALIAQRKVFARVVPQEHQGKAQLVPLKLDDTRIHLSFQKRTYEYDARDNFFRVIEYPDTLKMRTYVEAARNTESHEEEQVLAAMTQFGPNKLEMPVPSFRNLFQEQLLEPFFTFQVFCILLWVLDTYWLYSVMTLGMMFMFEATVVMGRLRSLRELRGMRNRPRRIYVYRNRTWKAISSLALLPGDIISLTRGNDSDATVPCDVLLLAGGAVVNEAMLTGESIPLIKEPVPPLSEEDAERTLDIRSSDKRHVLFGGTKVLTHTAAAVSEYTPPSKTPDGGCVCYVLRTGFGSAQGKLLRTILMSTENVTANTWEAALFIAFLLFFALLASGYVFYVSIQDPTRSYYKVLLHCLMIITTVVPPELPMQLAIAVNSSLLTLAKKSIFCTEPYRIPMAGKLDVCCFDKTGTLTTDNLNAAGVALPSVSAAAPRDGEVYALKPTAEASFDAACVLAACHSLVHVESELVGDPLELAALHGVEWQVTRSGVAVPKKASAGTSIKVLHRHGFLSKLQRMAVVAQVERGGSAAQPRVLVKGSPEAVGGLLAPGERTKSYDATATDLARRGMRVLALAYRDLDPGATPTQLKNVTRAEAETDLRLAGLVAFECPLRSDSRATVKALRGSGHLVSMLTGDAVLTAIHVGKEVGITSRRVLILEESKDKSGMKWLYASSDKIVAEYDASQVRSLAEKYDLAVSGVELDNILSTATASLPYIRVFARMAPEQKERVVTAMKDLGLITLMCGDGTNDVGALKQSQVGVALLSYTAPLRKAPPTLQPSAASKNQTAAGQGTASGRAPRASVGSAQLSSRTQRKTASRASTAKSTVSGGAAAEKQQTDSSSNGASRSGPQAADQAEDDLSHLSEIERLRELQRRKLRQQLDDLQNTMAEDGPKLVKLGDASIASPFTAKNSTINSCAVIIRQGRCTLMTTLQMYQILALNCLSNAYVLSVLHLDGLKFGDKQMTVLSVVLALLFFFLSRAQPLERLSAQRPPNTVFHPSLFLSLLAQFGVHLACVIYLERICKPFLPLDFKPDVEGQFYPNVLNTVMFLVSFAQQTVVLAVNYKGHPFMQSLRENNAMRNILLWSYVAVLLVASEFMMELNETFQLIAMPTPALRRSVIMVILLDAAGAFVIDRSIVAVFRPRLRKT